MSIQDQAIQYYELVKRGVPPEQAYRQAFPDGLPTEEDEQKKAAKDQQKQALGAVGGTVAGAMLTQAAMDAVAGKEILGGILSSGGGGAAASAAQPAATATLSAPQIISATPTAATATGGAAAPAASAGMGLGGALSVAGGLAGAYGMYDLTKDWGDADRSAKGMGKGALQGAASGAGIGGMVGGPVGAALGAGLGGLYGLASSYAKAGKHKDQKSRDSIRDLIRERGAVDDDWNLTLADGAKYDIGLDGGAKLQNVGGGTRAAYHADSTLPGVEHQIANVNPLAVILSGGDKKLTNDYGGYFTNAITSSGDARANALKLYKDMGINSRQDALAALDKIRQQNPGAISDHELAVYDQGLVRIFEGVPNPAPVSLPGAPAQPARSGPAQVKKELTPEELEATRRFGGQLVRALR